MQKKHIAKFAAALFLSIASLGALSAGCMAEPDPADVAAQEAESEATMTAEQKLTGDCPNQTGCDAYCESRGLVWNGCTLTTGLCRCGIDRPAVGAGPV